MMNGQCFDMNALIAVFGVVLSAIVLSEALEEGMAVVGTSEAGSSATILPESILFPMRVIGAG